MTFAKCIGGEPDRFFTTSTATPSPPAVGLKMRQVLGWTSRPSKDDSQQQPERTPQHSASDLQHAETPRSQNNDDDFNEDGGHGGKTSFSSTSYSSRTTIASVPTPSEATTPTVTYRKGEKSFLDFHQHYAITRHLGEGSYSTVKQVTHRKKGGLFACKIVDKLSLSPVDRIALDHEIRVLSSVAHENVMKLHEVIEDDVKCYLVMELAENGDLFDRIVKQGKFQERDAQRVLGGLVEALYYCHSRAIIHRDIKPENVLLSGDNIKLCDFGFAKQLNSVEEQSTDSCGTPGYAAPEILDGKPYGIEVDVFSLGVVTYIMLCGYPPFPMKLSQLRTHRFNVRFPSKDWINISASVKELISKMLSVNPAQRPSAEELRSHSWVRAGKKILDQLRSEAENRKRMEVFARKQQMADDIRKKLSTNGFEVVKYGRNGLPHRTKLRLSTDGKTITWQPKFFKRGLLRYQNARSFTSIFGLNKESGNGNNPSSQPELHVPQINRASTCDLGKGRNSEPLDESERSSAVSSSATSVASTTSSTNSDAINRKKMWWRSFRRDRAKNERTASGGYSLSLSSRPTFFSSEDSPGPEASTATTVDDIPSTTSPDRLDDSFSLHDIRQLIIGSQSAFFIAGNSSQTTGSKRAVDLSCVLSITTRFRDLHLEFPSEEIRDGFSFLIEQATLPLERISFGTQNQRFLSQPNASDNGTANANLTDGMAGLGISSSEPQDNNNNHNE